MRWAEVIGDPVVQSKSPVIHRFWLEALGMAGDYRRTRVPPADLGAWFANRRADRMWAGANVTMPLKEAVIPFLDSLSDGARALGAVNCIVAGPGGRLVGHNSDVDGVAEPLRARGVGAADLVQLVGAGGAARAAVAGARAAGISAIHIHNRTLARAQAMAQRMGLPEAHAHGLSALAPLDAQRRHILINASAMGMAGQPALVVDLAAYAPGTILFDCVYAPLETPLLAEGRRLGMPVIDGLEMLVGQAAVAFGLFFGAAAPRARDAELRARLLA